MPPVNRPHMHQLGSSMSDTNQWSPGPMYGNNHNPYNSMANRNNYQAGSNNNMYMNHFGTDQGRRGSVSGRGMHGDGGIASLSQGVNNNLSPSFQRMGLAGSKQSRRIDQSYKEDNVSSPQRSIQFGVARRLNMNSTAEYTGPGISSTYPSQSHNYGLPPTHTHTNSSGMPMSMMPRIPYLTPNAIHNMYHYPVGPIDRRLKPTLQVVTAKLLNVGTPNQKWKVRILLS